MPVKTDDCKKIRRLLALRPGDRSAAEQSMVTAHLAACPGCAALARAYAGQDRLIRNAPRAGLTALQRGQLFLRIQRERRRTRMHIRLSKAVGAAALLVVVAGLALGLNALLPRNARPASRETAALTATVPHETREVVPATPEQAQGVSPDQEIDTQEAVLTATVPHETREVVPATPEQAQGVSPGQEIDAQELEAALIGRILPWATGPWARCGWEVLGEMAQELYVWAYCQDGVTATSLPAVARLRQDESGDWHVQEVQIPRDGTLYGQDVRALFPPEVQARISAHDIDLQAIQEKISARVTLVVFSGRPDPTWLLTPVEEEALWQKLGGLPEAGATPDEKETVSLGYRGFQLWLPAGRGRPARQVRLFEGSVRLETEGQISWRVDENRLLEQWLLEIAAEHMAPEDAVLIDTIDQEIKEAPSQFAIYLVVQTGAAQDSFQAELNDLELEETPVLSMDDIVRYVWDTHRMTLTDAAYERLARLPVPVAPGLPFVVCVGGERIYAGEFWTSLSSAIYHGIVIDVLPATAKRPLRIQLGYPESEFFTGEDLRADPRIMRALEEAGKFE